MKQLFAVVGASLALGMIYYSASYEQYTQLPMDEIKLAQVTPLVILPNFKVQNERTSQV